jgi:hypothetical protein
MFFFSIRNERLSAPLPGTQLRYQRPQPIPHVRPSLCAKLIWKMSCASYGKPSVITVGQNSSVGIHRHGKIARTAV